MSKDASNLKLETCPFDPRFPNMNQTNALPGVCVMKCITHTLNSSKPSLFPQFLKEQLLAGEQEDPEAFHQASGNDCRHCWQSYVDYYRCRNLRGDEYEPCNYFQKCYKSLCPKSWISKWDTQREEGRFPGRLTV